MFILFQPVLIKDNEYLSNWGLNKSKDNAQKLQISLSLFKQVKNEKIRQPKKEANEKTINWFDWWGNQKWIYKSIIKGFEKNFSKKEEYNLN